MLLLTSPNLRLMALRRLTFAAEDDTQTTSIVFSSFGGVVAGSSRSDI
jgi:hypothetical protein